MDDSLTRLAMCIYQKRKQRDCSVCADHSLEQFQRNDMQDQLNLNNPELVVKWKALGRLFPFLFLVCPVERWRIMEKDKGRMLTN